MGLTVLCFNMPDETVMAAPTPTTQPEKAPAMIPDQTTGMGTERVAEGTTKVSRVY